MKAVRQLVQEANRINAALMEAQDLYTRKPTDKNRKLATEAAEQYVRFRDKHYDRFVRELTKCLSREDAP